MIINSKLKLALSAMLLFGGASAYAADTATDAVELKNGTKISWAKFVTDLNNPSSIKGSVGEDSDVYKDYMEAYDAYYGNKTATPAILGARPDSIAKAEAYATAKANYETAQGNLTQWQSELSTLSSDKITAPWLTTILEKAQTFETAFDDNDTSSSATISYKEGKDDWGDLVLTLSFTGAPSDGGTWKTVSQADFKTYIKTQAVSTLFVYMGENYKTATTTDTKVGSTTYKVSTVTDETKPKYLIQYAVAAIQSLTSQDAFKVDPNATKRKELTDNIATLTGNAKDAQGNDILVDGKTISQLKYLLYLQQQAEAAANTAAGTAVTARATMVSTKAAYDKAVAEAGATAIDNYNTVKLIADVTASTAFTNAYTGTIDADGKVITISGVANDANLFSNFRNGHLENAIINGKFAANGSFTNVAVWRGTTGTYYDDLGNNIGTINNIGELAYKVRDNQFFAANIKENKLIAWDEAYQTYSITAYQPDATTPFYTNIADGEFVNNPLTDLSVNTLYKSETNDFGNIANVIVGTTCANLVIEDKASFFCPFDITATNVTLNRTLKKGYNTVCLPFALKASYFGANDLRCTYDKETAEKFWFNKVAGDINANTPVLLYLEAAKDLALKGVIIKATPADQLVYFDGATDDASEACGFFKNASADEIRGASEAYKVYGLQGGGGENPKFNPAGTATFGATRMVIRSEIAQGNAPMLARGIAIVDEKGIEINPNSGSSNMEIVDMEATSLEIKGGFGEIIITTDADYGTQAVYSLDGKIAAMVDVVEGTNTVRVQNGVYVVMGQKVLVK